MCLCLVLPAGDVRHSRDPWCRQPLPKLKENAIKQMAVIVFLSLLSRPFAALTDLLYTGDFNLLQKLHYAQTLLQ